MGDLVLAGVAAACRTSKAVKVASVARLVAGDISSEVAGDAGVATLTAYEWVKQAGPLSPMSV